MRVHVEGVARLGWHRLCAVSIAGVDPSFVPAASFSFGSSTVPVPIFPAQSTRGRNPLWVILFPYLDDTKQGLTIFDESGGSAWQLPVHSRSFNLLTSLTCRIRAGLTSEMKNVVIRGQDEGILVSCLGIYPYEEGYDVVRICATYPVGMIADELTPEQVLGGARSIRSHVLRSGLNDRGQHEVILSYLIDRSSSTLVFSVPGVGGYQPGLLCLSPIARAEYLGEFVELTRDAAGDPRYAEWFINQRPSEDDLAAQRGRSFDYSPFISIITPVYRPPLTYLKECVESVIAQTYGNWELVLIYANPKENHDPDVGLFLGQVKVTDPRIRVVELSENKGIVGNTNVGINAAKGDYLAFLDQDDLIEPDALFAYVSRINEHPQAGLLYCDEDSFTEKVEEVFSPRFKPDYNPDMLYSHNYIVHMLMIKRSALAQVGLSRAEVEGAQDYDLSLRVSEVAPVEHIARVLYHWRQHELSTNSGNASAKPYAIKAGVNALAAHFDRRGIEAAIEPAKSPYTYRVTYPAHSNPLVSVIIPTKDHTELLGPCIDSLLACAGYKNLEVLVVENNSEEPSTFDFYNELLAADSRIRLIEYEGPFNYSAIVNYAACQARGELLFFLNNDTVTITDGLIEILAGYFQRPEVGIVGPLLLFPDGLVQTAGLALMSDGRLGFINQNLTLATHGGYLGSLECPRNYSAVLGAAQMVRRDTFFDVGGYDEALAVTYNDVDFCWRVRETGKLVVYTPHAIMTHREFATRGRDGATPERAATTKAEAGHMRVKWPAFFSGRDPELNPECSPTSPWFKLDV